MPRTRFTCVVSLLLLSGTLAMAEEDFATAAARAQDAYTAAYGAKDWKAAVVASRQLVELFPGNGLAWYNMACVEALGGEPEAALISLEKAVKNGFHEADHIVEDTDLETLRDTARFKELVAEARAAAMAEWDAFVEKAAASKPLVVVPPGLKKGAPAPLLLLLQPYAGTAEMIADVWRVAAETQGAIIVAPRAVNPAGEGFEWGTPAQARYITEAALAQAKKDFNVSETILSGFSQGGYVAFDVGLRHPDWFSAVVPVAGAFSPDDSPIPAGPLPRFRILIGENDKAIDTNRQAAELLEAAGGDVVLKVYPGVGHGFPNDYNHELTELLAELLGKGN